MGIYSYTMSVPDYPNSNRWPLILLFFMYMDTLYTCMFVSCVSYAAGDSKRLSDPPETRIRDGFELPYRN